MTTTDNRLGDFLRARRELVDPDAVGLPNDGLRRVKGLRREELAMLAGVSSHYYARLEQGRDDHPSPQILSALAAALRLDDEALAHMRTLAEPPVVTPRRRSRPERVRPGLAHLLTRWSSEPALIVGRYRDVLAANALAPVLHAGFAPGRNLVRDVFLEPSGRCYPQWEEVADSSVAGLRASAAGAEDDQRFVDLVGELSLKSEHFRRLWARHDVRAKTSGTKVFDNPFVGRVTLEYESFHVSGTADQVLYVFFAEPGGDDERALTLLAGLAADGSPRA